MEQNDQPDGDAADLCLVDVPIHGICFYGKMMNNQWILGGCLIFRQAHRVYEKLLLGGLSRVY